MNINEIKEVKFKRKNRVYSLFFPPAKGGKLQEFKIPSLWFLRQHQNTFHFNRGGLKSGNYTAKSATLTKKKKNRITYATFYSDPISKHLKRFPMKTLPVPQTFPD